jgi:hypothetical protein
MKKEIVLDTDPNLCEYKTNVKGWVGKDGRFYGNNKEQAIHCNSTHKKCEKGHVYIRNYINCPDCQSQTIAERYFKLDFVQWDGKTPLALYDDDKYFFDEEDIQDYADENEVRTEELMLVICTPEYLPEVGEDYFEEAIPADWELEDTNPEVYQKLKELNEVISKAKASCWYPGKFRTTIKL